MKHTLRNLILALALVAAALLVVVNYAPAYIGASSSSTYTNLTDLSKVDYLTVNVTNPITRFTNVILAFDLIFTNAPAGTIAVAYTTGPDWGMENSAASSPTSGWFSFPATNSLPTTNRVIFNTNLVLASHGAVAVTYLTNSSGTHCTNVSVRFFTKGGIIRVKR